MVCHDKFGENTFCSAPILSPILTCSSFFGCRQTTVWPTTGTDRGPFQSRPKVPIRKLSPSQGIKTSAILARLLGRAAPIHAPVFYEFAEQILFYARGRAKKKQIGKAQTSFRQAAVCYLYRKPCFTLLILPQIRLSV